MYCCTRDLLAALTFTVAVLGMQQKADAQCTNYIIEMPDDPAASEISWSLVDQNGVTWISGGAPFGPATICMPDGCYTLLMFDSGGDDWDGLDWDIEAEDGGWQDHTTLNNASQGFEQFELGDGDCNIGGGTNCTGGQNPFIINSEPGGSPGQMSWTLALNGVVISSGGSNTNDTLCLDPTCLVLTMNDSGGNGWQGGSITITDENGAVVFTGTLAAGSTQTVSISIDGGNCANPGGGGPGGGGDVPGTGPGGGCSGLPPGGDCAIAGCACDPFTFQITPSGSGNVNEVPAAGSQSNPSFFGVPPWGGPSHTGCLLAGELNSTWITFTVGTSGTLQFAFGAGGQQIGFYDWAMWPLTGPATCSAISSNTLPPVRCVWNATTVGGTGIASSVPAGGFAGNYDAPLPVIAGQRFIICLSNWSFVNTAVTLDFFGTAGIQCGPTSLPIELLYFTAFDHGDEVLAEWSTASELNSDHFEVERSADGTHWYRVGSVAAAGNSIGTRHYEWTDQLPLFGQSYYRLKEVDFDAAIEFSDMAAVYRPGSNAVHIWPQPNNGVFNATGIADRAILIDALGRSVPIHVAKVSEVQGFEVQLLDPIPGTYFLMDPDGIAPAMRVLVSR